ncbi:ABC transporter ATP-binding protein [Pseudonocardia acaciae]|uniref:ABC transporter ATP-binding protein n=1 Tax=Pseudonocardia acaciae TaxID=551276 RepID=UPI0024810FBF|nr:ABC transporter ATP-binding protein [Pseudonocardia acaciae]
MTVRRWAEAGLTLSRTAREAVRLAWSAAPVAVVGTGLLALGTAALPVLVAWLTKLVVDALTGTAPASLERLLWLAGGLVVAGLLLALLPRVSTFVSQEAARAIALRSQELLYRAVDGFHGLARFEDPVFLDRMRIGKQSAAQAPKAVVDAGISLAGGTVTAVGFLGSLVIIRPALAVVVLAAAIPALVAQLRLSRERAGMMWTIGPAERREFFFGTLLTDVQAAKEIRLFGAGRFLRERMLTERRTADAARRRQDLRDLFTQGGLALLSAGVAGGGLVWAIVQAHQGTITAGDVTMLVAAVAGVQSALTQLTVALAGTYQQLLMFEHYVAVARAEPDLSVAATPVAAPPLRRGIELRDVWFRYSERHPWVLRGVDLFVPAGQATALVGRNGAGKSTVIKLLCRLYDPSRGAILWDGVDLREMDIAALRRRLGAVFQDFMHYDLTATENVALGDTDLLADRERVVAAARLAGIHDTLAALPHGYDTMLSRMYVSERDKEDPETGVVLSGGQWQRLALARAFLRDQRDLLILDEPSSGLDAVAEHEVHTTLREHRSGRTSILISHRLGAVRDADQIVVLDGGRIVERGGHGELMKARGRYAELFELQAAGYQPDLVAD